MLIDEQLPEPMSDEEKLDRLQNDKQPKILFPDLSNPIIRGHPLGLDDKGGLAKNQDTLRYLIIDRYYKCLPQSQWDPEPNQAQKVVVLPNRNSIDQYKRAAQDYIKRAGELVARPGRRRREVRAVQGPRGAVAQAHHRGARHAVPRQRDSRLRRSDARPRRQGRPQPAEHGRAVGATRR